MHIWSSRCGYFSSFHFFYILCLIIPCFSGGCFAEPVPSILYVKGCRNSDPPRDTRGCFSESKATCKMSLMLSVHAVNLMPFVNGNESDSRLRVVLRESTPQSYILREEDDSNVRTWMPPLNNTMVLFCQQTKIFSASHSQVVSCNLPHPSTSSASHFFDKEQMKSQQEGPFHSSARWFDLFLEANTSKGLKLVTLLRRCVEIYLKSPCHPENGTDAQVGSVFSSYDGDLGRLLENSNAKKGHRVRGVSYFAEDLDDVMVQLQIGGLKKELEALFHRVVLPRMPSQSTLLRSLGLRPVRGVLLCGPDGNGKHLLARAIAQLLDPEVRLTITSAEDIFLDTTARTRNLREILESYHFGGCTESEDDYTKQHLHRYRPPNGVDNGKRLTHVLIIEQFEALFQQSNHFLKQKDKVDVERTVKRALFSLMSRDSTQPDILVFGLATHLDAVATSLLVPGFFELLISIPTPDASAREKILQTHTRTLRDRGALPDEMDLSTLVRQATGFSGADIAAVVRSAACYALLRQGKVSPDTVRSTSMPSFLSSNGADLANASTDASGNEPQFARTKYATEEFHLQAVDFDRALRDARRAKGGNDFLNDELASLEFGEGEKLVDYDGTLERSRSRVQALASRVLGSRRASSGVVALTAGLGYGKTVMAQHLARAILPSFLTYLVPCRKLIEIENAEVRVRRVRDVLCRASRSERSLIVLDDYDMLLRSVSNIPHLISSLKNILYDFAVNGNGPSFCADVSGLGDLFSTFEKTLPQLKEKNRQILIVTMTDESVLRDLPYDLHVRRPPLTFTGIQRLLEYYRITSERNSLRAIAKAYPSSLSYRHFLRLTDMALWDLKVTINDAPHSVQRLGALDEQTLSRTGVKNRSQVMGNTTMQKNCSYEVPWFFSPIDDYEDGFSTLFRNSSSDVLRKKQERENFFLVSTVDMAQKYVLSVDKVVRSTGMADPFASWYHKGPVTPSQIDDAFDGDEANNDAEGDVLEILW